MKRFLSLIGFVICAPVYSQSNLPPCQGTNVAEWTNCFGIVRSNETLLNGEWKGGKLHGQGSASFSNGDAYVGQWRSGSFHGQGIYTFDNGLVREGIWENSLFQRSERIPDQIAGRAPTTNPMDQKCTGTYSRNWSNCFGSISFMTGKSYAGTFLYGDYHGLGSLTLENGDLYIGEFVRDARHGLGRLEFANGDVYIGEFARDKRHGRGRITYANGDSPVEGVWDNGVFVRAESIPDHIAGRTYVSSTQSLADDSSAASGNKGSRVVPALIPQTSNENVQMRNEKRIALVIGNASYKTAPLDNPLNDATDIANELKRRGFKVISHNNANLRSLQKAVRDFSDEFKKSDVGLIYYSGHGVETKGQNYLIPVDADIRKEYELSAQGYPASQLTAMMEEVQSSDDKKRVAILILDACRDNPLTRSWRSSGRGLARMDAPAGTFISFSTSPGSVASDGRGRNSPFTKHLLQAIRKPDVPIELMFKQVRVGVMDETKGEQIPWDSSSLTGDFYFSRSNERK